MRRAGIEAAVHSGRVRGQMNAMGLDAFVRGKIYEALKNKAVQPA